MVPSQLMIALRNSASRGRSHRHTASGNLLYSAVLPQRPSDFSHSRTGFLLGPRAPAAKYAIPLRRICSPGKLLVTHETKSPTISESAFVMLGVPTLIAPSAMK